MRKWTARALWLLVACVSAVTCCAQYYSTGADPLGLKWLRLDGGRWRVNADSAAWLWAWLANGELSARADSLAADFPPLSLSRRDVDVVVHSHHAYSNGLVSWAPRRLEAYSYNIGSDDCVPWHSHLMTHEYRHVLQSQSTMTGFSRFLYGLFGEQSTGLILGLFVPRWYLEGDAVWAETNYTEGGRGRNPAFVQQMRALCVSGRTPSFGQAYFGSYATRVPDFYSMGYLMVHCASAEFGNSVFGNAVRQSGRLPFTFFPFQRSLRKQTGMRPMALYRHAIRQWSDDWSAQMAMRSPTPAAPLLDSASFYRETLDFTPWSGGYVAYATSPEFVSRFEVYDKDMRLVRTIASAAREETAFTVGGGKMAWSERRQHCRWANASENCLLMADLRTGRVERLTRGEDCHSPALSAGGDSLAYVAAGDDMSHSVMLRCGGSTRRLVRMPVGWQVPELLWQDGRRLVMLVVNDDGRQIARLDTESGKCELLFGSGRRMVRDLSADGAGRIFFTMNAGTSCFADVYSLSLPDGVLRREVVSRHGAAFPVALGDSLMVSLYGPDGYMPSVVGSPEGVNLGRVGPFREFDVPTDTARVDGFRRVGPMEAHIKPNVHSWGPILVDADAQTVKPGLGIASQNVLGTVYWQAGYSFAPDDDAERVVASVTWDWLWPRLKFEGKWGHADYAYTLNYKQLMDVGGQKREYNVSLTTDDRSHLSNLTLGLSLPLTRNDGGWLRAVTPSASLNWERSTGLTYDVALTESSGGGARRYRTTTDDSRYFCSTFGVSSHIWRRTAENDVGYRVGVSLSAVYDRAVRHLDYGSLLNLNLQVYLPGVGRHHQLLLAAYGQKKWPGEMVATTSGYYYRRMVSDRVAAPYGLARVSNKESALLRAAYTMPLCNPDWQWGPVTYIKRINMRLVGDYGWARTWGGTSVSGTSRRWTASAELWAETRLATLTYPVGIGWRGTYLPDDGGVASTLLLSVSFR